MTISMTDLDEADSQDPWSRYSVLSLDGSGLRVLSELLILERLMDRIIHWEREVKEPYSETSADSPLIERNQISNEYKKLRESQHQKMRDSNEAEPISSRYLPCHYFDFVAGTSTGGLVALMLGELRMTVAEALDFYLKIMPQLYRLLPESKFRKIIRMKRRNFQDELFETIDTLGKIPMSSDESRCKTVVCSFTESENGQVIPHLFRSYEEMEFDQANLTISEIARASCCHPYSFEPVKFGISSYYDTGLIFTNPSSIIIDELHKFRPVRNDRETCEIEDFEREDGEQKSDAPVALLVSLGSGYDLTKKFDTGSSTTARFNRVLRATAEPVHKEVYRRSKTDDAQIFSYTRLNANLALSKVVIGYSSKKESKKLRKEIEERTKDFLSDSEIKKEVDETASKLVSLRRLRCRTRAWEAFAFGWRYKCSICKKENATRDVDKAIETFHSAADLIDHFLQQHDSLKFGSEFNQELQMLTKESRTNSDELRKEKKSKMIKT